MSKYILSIVFLFVFLSQSANATKVTIATWNIGFLTEQNSKGCFPRTDQDFEKLKKYVNRLDADLIAFQEVENLAAAKRIFDSNIYDIEISRRVVAQRNSVCRGQPGQFLTPQLVGFAVRKSLKVRGIKYKRLPDVEALSTAGGARYKSRHGVEISINVGETEYRFLSVHLKSGCFDKNLPTNIPKSCVSLWSQMKVLENWIDQRTSKGIRTIVMGDFNRRLNNEGDIRLVAA